jgi:hypothetical protein
VSGSTPSAAATAATVADRSSSPARRPGRRRARRGARGPPLLERLHGWHRPARRRVGEQSPAAVNARHPRAHDRDVEHLPVRIRSHRGAPQATRWQPVTPSTPSTARPGAARRWRSARPVRLHPAMGNQSAGCRNPASGTGFRPIGAAGFEPATFGPRSTLPFGTKAGSPSEATTDRLSITPRSRSSESSGRAPVTTTGFVRVAWKGRASRSCQPACRELVDSSISTGLLESRQCHGRNRRSPGPPPSPSYVAAVRAAWNTTRASRPPRRAARGGRAPRPAQRVGEPRIASWTCWIKFDLDATEDCRARAVPSPRSQYAGPASLTRRGIHRQTEMRRH